MHELEINNAALYFDQNTRMILKEKLTTQSSKAVLDKFSQRSIALSKKYNIQEYIKQANISLIDLAKDVRTTPQDF